MKLQSSAEMLAELKARQTLQGTEVKPVVVNRLRDLKEGFLLGYCKLTRAALDTDRSQMDVPTHHEFCTIIDRAQQILRLEALQTGLRDPRELSMNYGKSQ